MVVNGACADCLTFLISVAALNRKYADLAGEPLVRQVRGITEMLLGLLGVGGQLMPLGSVA